MDVRPQSNVSTNFQDFMSDLCYFPLFFPLQYFAFLFLANNSENCKANNSPKSVDFFAELELPNYTKISKYCANEIVAESWR